MKARFLPAVLIAIGVGFLLYNLKIISFTPWDIFWPGLLILLGLTQLRALWRGPYSPRHNSGELVLWIALATLGFYMLLPRMGILVPSLPWQVIWPILLIAFGILKLLPGRGSRFRITKTSSFNEDLRYQSSFVGEIRRGPSDWVLDDLYIRQGIGSVSLDLTQAIIPQREIDLHISGYVGEAVLYLPPGLPFKAECSLSLGEITVLDRNETGSQKYVALQTADYDTAACKLNIKIHWKIGEVRIRQIN